MYRLYMLCVCVCEYECKCARARICMCAKKSKRGKAEMAIQHYRVFASLWQQVQADEADADVAAAAHALKQELKV